MATEAAERYAFNAAIFSIPFLLAAILLFLLVRNDLRSCCLASAALCVHPLWTVTDPWYDNGAWLRLASTAWMVVALVATTAAMISVYRHRRAPRPRLNLRITYGSLMVLTVFAAMALALARPPLSEQIPVSRSLPALGMMIAMVVAFQPGGLRHQRERPARVEVPGATKSE